MKSTCPSCDARLHEGAVLCVECGFHLEQKVHLSTELTTDPAVAELTDEASGYRDFFLPILKRFVTWFAFSFAFCFFATWIIYLVNHFFLEEQLDGIPILWVMIPHLIVSLKFAMIIAIAGVIAKSFVLLASDSPLAAYSILSILAVTIIVYLFVIAWDWGFSMP